MFHSSTIVLLALFPTLTRAATGYVSATGTAPKRELAQEQQEDRYQGPLNILFLIDDQHNARALGCAGHELAQTPNIDRLAAEGTRFPLAFTQSGQCCPSRYTLWTGRYPRSHGLRWNGTREVAEEVTLFEILREQGYVTGTIGKHHMLQPLDEHGFDSVVDMRDYQDFRVEDSYMGEPRRERALSRTELELDSVFGYIGAATVDNEHHRDGYFATQGMEFMRRNAELPWCLWLSFYGPHTPITPSEPWASSVDPNRVKLPPSARGAAERARRGELGPVLQHWKKSQELSEEAQRTATATYLGFIAQIDYNIGRVLDELRRLGIEDRTIVIFTSDHGDLMGEHGAWRKGVFGYDATLRVPLIIKGPGISAQQVRNELVGLIDLAPTILDWTGVETPANMQGRSLAGISRGESPVWRDWIVSELGLPGSSSGHSIMARTARYKYVRTERHSVLFEELFDLELDPWETVNLIGSSRYRNVSKDLMARLEDWERMTEAAPFYPVLPKSERGPAPR